MEHSGSGGQETSVVDEEKIWKGHIAFAQEFLGSDAEYCKRNGLSLRIFRTYKEKYGVRRRRGRGRKAFVKIESIKEEKAVVHDFVKAPRPSRRELPDAQWTAEFLTALMSRL